MSVIIRSKTMIVCHEAVKGERQMDDVFANRLANDLKDAFDKLMNREY